MTLDQTAATTGFIQVWQGKMADPDLFIRQVAKWRAEIRPRTTGFLGFTSGLTTDGHEIVVARFTSEEMARADNDMPEQGTWWATTATTFDGEVTFHDCRTVDTLLDGGSNDAGFVQIMQGRAKDEPAMRARMKAMEPELRKTRPELIGATVAWHGDGTFTQVAYFTSEAEARKNEQATAQSPLMTELRSMIDGELSFYDLPDPDME